MTDEFPAPVVATSGAADPAAPLVVLLHGRGSSEREIISLADHLPVGPAYAAVRGLILADPDRFAGAAMLFGTLPSTPVSP